MWSIVTYFTAVAFPRPGGREMNCLKTAVTVLCVEESSGHQCWHSEIKIQWCLDPTVDNSDRKWRSLWQKQFPFGKPRCAVTTASCSLPPPLNLNSLFGVSPKEDLRAAFTAPDGLLALHTRVNSSYVTCFPQIMCMLHAFQRLCVKQSSSGNTHKCNFTGSKHRQGCKGLGASSSRGTFQPSPSHVA